MTLQNLILQIEGFSTCARAAQQSYSHKQLLGQGLQKKAFAGLADGACRRITSSARQKHAGVKGPTRGASRWLATMLHSGSIWRALLIRHSGGMVPGIAPVMSTIKAASKPKKIYRPW